MIILKNYTRKIIISLIALLLIGAAAFGALDNQGEKYVNTSLTRALVAFGVSRSINGVISVAQGTELSIHPAGVGVNLAPGQILDPINDLIERFSTVMLFSASSLGIQKLVLEVASGNIFMVLSAIVILLLLVNEWRSKTFLPAWFSRALIIFLIIRLSVPIMSIASEGFYQTFLKTNYERSIKVLETASSDIENLSKQDIKAANDDSILGQVKQIFKSAKDSVNMSKRFERYKNAASTISTEVVDMIVVFVVQTVLFPALFLWLVIGFSKKIIL
jgi:hypothetical protein